MVSGVDAEVIEGLVVRFTPISVILWSEYDIQWINQSHRKREVTGQDPGARLPGFKVTSSVEVQLTVDKLFNFSMSEFFSHANCEWKYYFIWCNMNIKWVKYI